jgi:hypothetical protein
MALCCYGAARRPAAAGAFGYEPIGLDKAPRSSAGALNAFGPVFSFQLAYQNATPRQINRRKADDSRAEGEP